MRLYLWIQGCWSHYWHFLFAFLFSSVPSVLRRSPKKSINVLFFLQEHQEKSVGIWDSRSPVHCCCNLRISAWSPFNVLAWSCWRKSRFFCALCSWFSSVTFAEAMTDDVHTAASQSSETKKKEQTSRFDQNLVNVWTVCGHCDGAVSEVSVMGISSHWTHLICNFL